MVAIAPRPVQLPDYCPALTPVEYLINYDIHLKRDDLFCFAGVQGGKVRSCLRLSRGAKMLVTASSRHSPQMTIVARIAQRLGIPARCHIPGSSKLPSPEMVEAQAVGATLVEHRPGYNSVIIARARADAQLFNGREIPFGMKCPEAVEETAAQVQNLPGAPKIKRIVVPVGSGISLSGILTGLQRYRPDLAMKEIVGIVVGADPVPTLDNVAGFGWRQRVDLRPAGIGYDKEVADARIGHVALDPHYEGKVLRFLRPGDCFWVVGIRRSTAIST